MCRRRVVARINVLNFISKLCYNEPLPERGGVRFYIQSPDLLFAFILALILFFRFSISSISSILRLI